MAPPSAPGRVEGAPAPLAGRARTLFGLALADRDAVAGMADDPVQFSEQIVCFHAQQAVEKAAKAVLVHRSGSAAEWHSISDLMAELRTAGAPVPRELAVVARLDRCAVKLRYELAPAGSIGIARADMLPLVDSFMQWAADRVEGGRA